MFVCLYTYIYRTTYEHYIRNFSFSLIVGRLSLFSLVSVDLFFFFFFLFILFYTCWIHIVYWLLWLVIPFSLVLNLQCFGCVVICKRKKKRFTYLVNINILTTICSYISFFVVSTVEMLLNNFFLFPWRNDHLIAGCVLYEIDKKKSQKIYRTNIIFVCLCL